MSRIGNKPITVPSGVTVAVNGSTVEVKGKNGTLSCSVRPEVSVKVEDGQVVVQRINDLRPARAFHGLTRALIANMVEGVSNGFKRELEIVGVGWNAQVKGMKVHLKIGYADEKIVEIPQGVKVEVQQNKITITGPDKQRVGQCAATIRSKRKPEPYNGTGIKYSDEIITRKQGKAFAGGGG